ncbi:ATP-binding protein [Patulibacter sp. SYSU D01012]|uniref:sensor histidine kinase n=1 Tax=Patulibacter sp. SYSU D01012 TaxID=2817381 RepID=UPI001B3089F3
MSASPVSVDAPADPAPGPPLVAPPQDAAEHTPQAGARLGSVAARATGALVTAIVVGMRGPVDGELVVVGVIAALWLVATAAWMHRRGLGRCPGGLVALVDLGLLFAVVGLSGGSASPAAVVLWLAPLAWALVYGPYGVAVLTGIAAAGYVALWAVDGDPGASADVSSLEAFLGVLVGSGVLSLMTVHLRTQAAARTGELLRVRAALRRELGRVEREHRAHTSRTIHDGPLQLFIAARQDLDEHREGDPEALRYALEELQDGIAALRAIVSDLHEDGEAVDTVRERLDAVVDRHRRRGRFAVALDLDPSVGDDDDPLVVDTVSELLRNAAKHAAPTHVDVRVHSTADGATTVVEVRDDGRGMDVADRQAAERGGHVGLRSMDRRVRAVGGRWQIRSAPGRGTHVRLELPR